MIRLFDILLSVLGIVLLFPLIIILVIFGTLNLKSPLFVQARIGLVDVD